MHTSLNSQIDLSCWTGARQLFSPSNNVESKSLPFQSWRPFKEAFAPEIVTRAVSETPGDVDRLIDPFGGSGTSALTSQFLGIAPTTIEVNPFLADLIEAKLCKYDLDSLTHDYAKIVAAIQSTAKLKYSSPPLPPTFIEPGVKGKFIFSKKLISHILGVIRVIDEVCGPENRRLFRILAATAAVNTSNIVVSGKGRRYRKRWEERQSTKDEFNENFCEKALDAIFDISRHSQRRSYTYELIRGDSREQQLSTSTFDVAVFSPPYPNSFDYTDVYNVELWLLGYLGNWTENRKLRSSTLRSHVQIKRDYSSRPTENSLLDEVYKKLDEARSELWSADIPEMVVAYFDDMKKVMSILSARLRKEGRVYCVVGDSQYAGLAVPVGRILEQVGPNCGLSFLYTEEFRSMRSSPQQGGKKQLPESLLVFEKNY